MLRKLLGVILLPFGILLYVLSLPLLFVFRILNGILDVLFYVMVFLYDHKKIVKVLVAAGCVMYALASFTSVASLIYSGIAIVVVMYIFSRVFDYLTEGLSSLLASVSDFFEGLAKAVSSWKKVFDYAWLNLRGFGGKSETELFKLTNSNYYVNHDLFEEKYMKKYGRKINAIE